VREAPPPPSSLRPPLLTREDVQALGEKTVAALKTAVELGYVARIPAILENAPPGHERAVRELRRLAAELELDTLMKLV